MGTEVARVALTLRIILSRQKSTRRIWLFETAACPVRVSVRDHHRHTRTSYGKKTSRTINKPPKETQKETACVKALTYQGVGQVEVKQVADATIEQPEDVLVRVTSTSICGSDLHLYQGMIPHLRPGSVIGHEPMGIVEEVGAAVHSVRKGDRVVVPFNVACGTCRYCTNDLESLCDVSNRNGDFGAYFGYSDTFGGYAGGQAEMLRVPYANFTSFRVPDNCELPDESLLFLSDIVPTAYWAALHAGVKAGDTVIILGCGPVGLLAQKFASARSIQQISSRTVCPLAKPATPTKNSIKSKTAASKWC